MLERRTRAASGSSASRTSAPSNPRSSPETSRARRSSLTTLQQDARRPRTSSSSNKDQFTSSFAQIVSTVQSGNLTAAQQAVSALQSGQATYGPPSRGGHHHHHHGSSSASSTSSPDTSSATSSTTAAVHAVVRSRTKLQRGAGRDLSGRPAPSSHGRVTAGSGASILDRDHRERLRDVD